MDNHQQRTEQATEVIFNNRQVPREHWDRAIRFMRDQRKNVTLPTFEELATLRERLLPNTEPNTNTI